MPDTLTPTSAETAAEDTLTLADPNEVARHIDEQAIAIATQKSATIASIADLQHHVLQAMLETGEINEEQIVTIEGLLQSMQAKRMAAIRNDTHAKVANLGENVLGMFDGKGLYLTQGIVDEAGLDLHTTYEHEKDHRKVGLPGHDLDTTFVVETGIEELDRRFHDEIKEAMTGRAALERSATDAEQKAGGEGSGLYLKKYVQPMEKLQTRAQKVDVDLRKVDKQYLDDKDASAYTESLVELGVREVAEEEGMEGLQRLRAEAESQTSNREIVDIITRVREEYENGPKGREEQRRRQEKLVAMAA